MAPPYLPLGQKLFLAFFLVLLPLLLFTLNEYRQQSDSAIQEQLEADRYTAGAVNALFDQAFDEGVATASTLASDPFVRGGDRTRIDVIFERFLLFFPAYQRVILWEGRGQIVTLAPPLATDEPPPTIASLTSFEQVLATGAPQISGVARVSGDEAVVSFLAPVLGASGRPVGVIELRLPVSRLLALVSSIQLRPGRSIVLTDPTGLIALDTAEPELDWSKRDGSQLEPIRQVLGSQAAEIVPSTECPFQNSDCSAVVQPSGKHRWLVGIFTSRASALAPVERALRLQLLVLGAIVLFSLAIGIVLSRLITQPIVKLREACAAVQRGDLHQRLRLRTGDELEQLGESFNRMIAELERQAEAKENYNRLREEFISVIAHDLRTPIQVIGGYATVLERLDESSHGSEVERRAVTNIRVSSQRLALMVSDLLDASRIESQRLTLQKQRLDLVAVIPEIIDRLAEVTSGHPVRLDIRERPPTVEADPQRLEQIMGNLLSNAAKYSEPGTEIIVTVACHGSDALISVADQGPGIAPDDLPHLFDRFFRAREFRARHEGLGLGLYITRGLIEAQGGRIWVASELGRGSTFVFTLPPA